VLELAVIVARLLQYLGAAILFGSSLFFIYALPGSGPASAAQRAWSRPLLVGAAILLAFGSLLGLGAQASLLMGSFADGLTRGAIGDVVSYLDLGKAAVVRGLAAVVALLSLVALRPGRTSWLVAAAFGAIAAASLAWMGHAAATEGSWKYVHLTSDAIHALAAAAWLGALASFALLLRESPSTAEQRQALYLALRRFSGVGSLVVSALVLSGLVNGWVLVGPQHVGDLGGSPYGRLLLLKLVLFLAMLILAASNRFRLTPAFGRSPQQKSLRPLKRSVALEAAAGAGVLVLVAWLGILSPPAAA
jgi:putative copper resistance protein D